MSWPFNLYRLPICRGTSLISVHCSIATQIRLVESECGRWGWQTVVVVALMGAVCLLQLDVGGWRGWWCTANLHVLVGGLCPRMMMVMGMVKFTICWWCWLSNWRTGPGGSHISQTIPGNRSCRIRIYFLCQMCLWFAFIENFHVIPNQQFNHTGLWSGFKHFGEKVVDCLSK